MKILDYIDGYLKNYTNYHAYWNYEDGCVLVGAAQLYKAVGDRKYLKFILDYLEPLIDEGGVISNYEIDKFNIDSFNCGKILFMAYRETKNEKYKKALDFLMEQLMKQPRTAEGNFWHKLIYPHQVWLDGLYMAQPFYMEYDTCFNDKRNYNDIIGQFKNVRRLMFDEEKKLYYHGYDEAKAQGWANPETGLSKNFWLRSMGWYIMALVDTIDATSDQIYEEYRLLCDLLKEAVHGLLKYRDAKSGLFYQVIDLPETDGNYTETSGSAMIAYSLMKAARLGVLNNEKYAPVGAEVFDALVNQKLKDGRLTDICKVAGLGPESNPKRDGTVEYYLSEPRVCDDAKGVGPFIMAYAQRLS